MKVIKILKRMSDGEEFPLLPLLEKDPAYAVVDKVIAEEQGEVTTEEPAPEEAPRKAARNPRKPPFPTSINKLDEIAHDLGVE